MRVGSVERVGEVAPADDDLGIGGIEELEQFDQPGTHLGAFISGCAAHQRNQALECGAHILVEDLHVGGRERGVDVARRGIGDGDGVRALCGCAREEVDLANRALRFDTARIGFQDSLIRLFGGAEVAGLKMLASLSEHGIDLGGFLGTAWAPQLPGRRRKQ